MKGYSIIDKEKQNKSTILCIGEFRLFDNWAKNNKDVIKYNLAILTAETNDSIYWFIRKNRDVDSFLPIEYRIFGQYNKPLLDKIIFRINSNPITNKE